MSGATRERGAALVITLVFVTAMAAAAVAFLAGRRTDALTLRGQLQAIEAQAMLEAALQQTVTLLANREPRQTVPPQLSWQFGEVAVRVRFERELGKIDLNAATDQMLRALPLALGLDEDSAATFADVIQDWRDENQLKLESGAEDRDYASGGGRGGRCGRPAVRQARRAALPAGGRSRGLVHGRALRHRLFRRCRAVGPLCGGSGAAGGADRPQPRARRSPTGGDRRARPKRTAPTVEPRQARRAWAAPAVPRRLPSRAHSAVAGEAGAREGLSRARDSRGGSLGADGAEEANGSGAGGEDETGPQSVLLDVRFPNGYEAAAKAVIALAQGGAGGPPFIVLDWTPILRARGDAS